jgi:hypothetical protein
MPCHDWEIRIVPRLGETGQDQHYPQWIRERRLEILPHALDHGLGIVDSKPVPNMLAWPLMSKTSRFNLSVLGKMLHHRIRCLDLGRLC